MKILGIIVEYNPFHTGHLYHLQKAKEMVKPDLTIAIMSGNYVQRGEVAIIDKFKRSELAIKYGVDLVIELPFAYVCQSADYFCKGAIDLLYHIGITDLVFGSECGDIDTFKEIAYAIKNHPNEYDQYIKAAMKKGLGCAGFNLVQNNGEVAGQTVFHFHMHLIPRYASDPALPEHTHLTLSDDEFKEICDKMKM